MSEQRDKKYSNPKLNLAAQELWEYRELKESINSYRRKCQEYEDRCDISAMRYDAVHVNGGTKDGLVNTICAWADLKAELERRELDAEHKLWVIMERLNKLDIRFRQVLTLYYIKGYSITKVAQMMNYSTQQIKRIKIGGLEKYSAFLHNEP